jgi:UDP-N-acetylmuramoyl-L-alanyl-D-glutamate--2,6-diaminopimelate ligase
MFDHALRFSKSTETIQALQYALASVDIALTREQRGDLANHLNGVFASDLVNDTRALKRNDIFCAVIGSALDGRVYTEQALEKSAALVISECEQENDHGKLIWLQVDNLPPTPQLLCFQLNQRLFGFAKNYYGTPQQHFSVVGITGTNGKTSTSQIIANLLDQCQHNCAVIGTTGAGKLSALTPLENTTPGATQLHKIFADFVEQGITDVAMEVSSHALAQKRVVAELFDIAVFTNLTRDHLDYHQTMADYAAAKQSIFTQVAGQIAVINADDPQAKRWLLQWPSTQNVMVFGLDKAIKEHSTYAVAENIQHNESGAKFQLATHLGNCEIHSQLLGQFNVENLLAAISVLIVKGVALNDIANSVKKLSPIIGRMEAFSAQEQPTAVIDYAHTPDALASALDACRLHCTGKLWVVFGCGGDRDVGKRPLMAKVAEAKADQIVLTNDNPRNEDPETITADILAGCLAPEKVVTLLDRKKATTHALTHAQAEDVVLFAGKGHEDYVIIGNDKVAYDERAIVAAFYQAREAL